jgi:uncharacterized membrane protein
MSVKSSTMHYSQSRIRPMKQVFKPAASSTKIAFFKTITYRILGSSASFCVAYFFTGNTDLSLSVGIADLLFKPLVYFVHELLWNKFVTK